MRYHIRSKGGEELEVADGKQVIRLLRQHFLDLDDEIRREGQEKWRRLGDIPEYASMMRAERLDARRFTTVFMITGMIALIAMIVAILIRL